MLNNKIEKIELSRNLHTGTLILQKGIMVLFLIFSFLCLNIITFNTCCAEGNDISPYLSGDNDKIQELTEEFIQKYGEDVKIIYDDSGRPATIRLKTAASNEKPEDIALSFLSENHLLLDIESANLKFRELKENRDVNEVIFQQVYKGVPVQNKDLRVILTKDGEITFVRSNYYPHADLDIVPQITPEAAAQIVADDLGMKELVQTVLTQEPLPDVWVWGVMEFSGFKSFTTETLPVVPELVIVPGKAKNTAHLVWEMYVCQELWALHTLYYAVDAHTGEIINKYNAITGVSIATGSDTLSTQDLQGALPSAYGTASSSDTAFPSVNIPSSVTTYSGGVFPDPYTAIHIPASNSYSYDYTYTPYSSGNSNPYNPVYTNNPVYTTYSSPSAYTSTYSFPSAYTTYSSPSAYTSTYSFPSAYTTYSSPSAYTSTYSFPTLYTAYNSPSAYTAYSFPIYSLPTVTNNSGWSTGNSLNLTLNYYGNLFQ